MELDLGPGVDSVSSDPSTKKPPPSLCERCEDIDFDWLYKLTDIPPSGIGVLSLGAVGDRDEEASCHVCRLFASVRPTLSNAQSYHLRALDAAHVLGTSTTTRRQRCHVLLAVVAGELVQSLSKTPAEEIKKEAMIALERYGTSNQRSSHEQPGHYSRQINPRRVDYEQLISWLEDCSRRHDGCQHPKPKVVPGMRVLDCRNLCAVPLDDHFEYYAFSYVCGGLQLPEVSGIEDFAFIPDFPQAVFDAIEIVLNLGGRYLWVDQYCIRASERPAQIRLMSRIYERAIATLVAVTGENISSPIPGVSCPRSTTQTSITVGKYLLRSTFPHVSRFLRASTWGTRAWTYQEALLSPRCLFFTDAQVYFTCKTSMFSEADPRAAKGHAVYVARKPVMLTQETSIFAVPQEEELKSLKVSRIKLEFYNQVAEYSTRLLTYEADALDAFKGILSRTSIETYWGIPLLCFGRGLWSGDRFHTFNLCEESDSVEDGFAKGLLWTTRTTARTDQVRKSALPTIERDRHGAFPTWSWACLRDSAVYMDIVSFDDGGVNVRGERYWSEASFDIEELNGAVTPLLELAQRQRQHGPEEPLIPEQTRWLHLTGPQISIRIKQGIDGYETLTEKGTALGKAWIDGPDEQKVIACSDTRVWLAVQLCGYSVGNSFWMILEEFPDHYRRVGLMKLKLRWFYYQKQEGTYRVG